ncbi:MAG: NfeD family protein [Prolixibacteraceae bacterium]|nr:NfeD family protein [Prolixibacteraceae bacterium]MBN2648533.1 NfeD family protein [Prolixibacteraceae bacterium]
MEFEIWHIWLMVSITFFILEIFIPSFVVFNFGIGALVAALAAAIELNLQWQILFFSIATLASFFSIRPVLKKWAYKRSHAVRTNATALIGRIGKVIETIDTKQNTGLVKIDGDVWQAKTDEAEQIKIGQSVEVTAIDSIVLHVKSI